MVKVKEVLPEPPALAVAVAVTLKVPAAVGVPEMVPVEEPIVMPPGRPVADQVYGAVPPVADSVNDAIAVPTTPDLLPGLPTVTPPLTLQVGSAVCAGTLTASHAALTVLNSVQLPGNRFLAAVSVQVRYFRYEDDEVFISIALYMILIAVWMPRPVTELPLHVGLAGWPLPLVPCDSR